MSAEVTSTVDACMLDASEDIVPNAEELETFYNILESGQLLELEWQCLGRRPPSPSEYSNCNNNNSDNNINELTNSVDIGQRQETMETNDFDFSDDIIEPQIRVRSNSTPKSAKKKTANFAGVMEVLKKKNAESSS